MALETEAEAKLRTEVLIDSLLSSLLTPPHLWHDIFAAAAAAAVHRGHGFVGVPRRQPQEGRHVLYSRQQRRQDARGWRQVGD